MNYLAHVLVAPSGSITALGNLLGDFVKGPLPGGLEPDFAAGVAAHRAVDAFVDRHTAFVASRRRLFDEFSHYAGVIVDLLYDHLLSVHWKRHGRGDLDTFCEHVYAEIDRWESRLPERVAEHARRIRDVDVLRRYRTEDGLREALRRTSLRLKRPVELERAVDAFGREPEVFTAEFHELFGDLSQWAASRFRSDGTFRAEESAS